MQDRTTGRVKWFSEDKGFGFARIDGDREDVFVHAKQLRCAPELVKADTAISFSIEQGNKGLRALAVELVQSD